MNWKRNDLQVPPHQDAGESAMSARIARAAALLAVADLIRMKSEADIYASGHIPADPNYGLTENEVTAAEMMNALLQENEELVRALRPLAERASKIARHANEGVTIYISADEIAALAKVHLQSRCRNCGRPRGEHAADKMACPIGLHAAGGFIDFSDIRSYEPAQDGGFGEKKDCNGPMALARELGRVTPDRCEEASVRIAELCQEASSEIVALDEACKLWDEQRRELAVALKAILANDGGKGSDGYHAARLYEAREAGFQALAEVGV